MIIPFEWELKEKLNILKPSPNTSVQMSEYINSSFTSRKIARGQKWYAIFNMFCSNLCCGFPLNKKPLPIVWWHNTSADLNMWQSRSLKRQHLRSPAPRPNKRTSRSRLVEPMLCVILQPWHWHLANVPASRWPSDVQLRCLLAHLFS